MNENLPTGDGLNPVVTNGSQGRPQQDPASEYEAKETIELSQSPTKRERSDTDDEAVDTRGRSDEPAVTIHSDLRALPAETGEYRSGESDRVSEGAFSVNQPTMEHQVNAGMVASGRIRSKPSSETKKLPKSIGSYEIRGTLGRGGMGVVYLAHQTALRRDVALKMVLAGKHASEDQLERFKAEARAVAKLQHPNIVQVFEVGEYEGLPYFSLEYVEGSSLDYRLDGKPIPAREAAIITEKICRAMQFAHDRGVLHRDLKPANILMTPSGEPKITDFGLAKQLDDEESASTRTGTVMGTPNYMSPEQAQGLLNDLTPASDQYSMGAILYELLTGRPPFVGTKAFDTLSQVVNKEPVPPCQLQSEMPVDIDTICLKALQKDPAKRYASCDALADDLQRFLLGEPIHARPVGFTERSYRWCKRNPWVALPSASALTLLIATAVISTWSFFQISMQATVIAQERDNVQEQRDEADKQRVIAEGNAQRAELEEAKAIREKEEAERQRILADEARLQAEKNQGLAEQQAMLALQNIQLVVTEVDDRLAKEPGMSSIRIGMLEVLEKKWDELDLALAGGIQGQAIPTLMTVRSKIADAWLSLDRISESNAQYEKIYAQAQERLLVKNRSDSARFNLALICIRWAPIKQRLTGDPKESEKLIDESSVLLREILKDPRPEPGSPQAFQIADALQQSLLRSASALLKAGESEKAEGRYREIQDICEDVLRQIADNAEWTISLPEDRKSLIQRYFQQNRDLARAGLANVLCSLGRGNEAIPIYETIIAGQREAVEKAPEDRNARDQLALQLRNYGQNMLRIGRTDDAVRLIGQSHDWAEKIYLADSTNANFKRSLGHSLYYWGVAREHSGQSDEALVLFERSRVIRADMVQSSPDQANRVNLMLSLARLGDHEQTKPLIEQLAASDKQDADLRLDLGRALAQLAKVTDEEAGRQAMIDQAIGSLQKAINEGLQDPFSLTSEVDLRPLSAEPAFLALVESLKKRSGK